VANSANKLVVDKTTNVVPYSLNMNTLYVDLSSIVQGLNKGFYFLNMSASNDNQNFGNEISLTAFNSKTHTCSGFSCNPITQTTPSFSVANRADLMTLFLFAFLANLFL
jgi:hypothetical protein